MAIMKTYFTADELHTPEYAEYVKHTSEVWRLNDERNKRIAEETRLSTHKIQNISENHLDKRE